MVSWIGKPLAKNRPHNFFNTNHSTTPAHMFMDNDKDGVPNVFDCKPNNPREQGFIDKIVGVVKGIGKKKGEIDYTQSGKTDRSAYERAGMSERQIVNAEWNKARAIRRKKQSEQRIVREAARRMQYIEESKPKDYVERKAEAFVQAIGRANPKYDMNMEYRGRKIALIKRELRGLDPNTRAYKRKASQLQKMRVVQEMRKIQMAKTARSQAGRAGALLVKQVFPMVTPMRGKHVMGAPGQRGRPRGSLDPRYAAYGGVFAYRRALAQQKKMAKLRQYLALQKMRAQRVPKYEVQQYQEQVSQQQVPQQVPQQQVPVQQMPQQQVVYQQAYPQPQMPQQPQQRPVATVFKSNGGSPYPPVDRRPLTPSKMTIDQGYIETTDAFTGKRIIKKLPPPEAWAVSRERRMYNVPGVTV